MIIVRDKVEISIIRKPIITKTTVKQIVYNYTSAYQGV